MTPKHRFDRGWVRETLIPILWILCASAMFGAAFGVAVAHSAPRDSRELGDIYAQRYAAAICRTLDEHPSPSGVAGIITAIEQQGFDVTAAATAVADSVFSVCPNHMSTLSRFIATYSATRT